MILAADVTDNELLLMESIHLFVEILDQDFSNVCEVRLPNSRLSCEWFDFGWFVVFHFNKVYMCLDEFILTGEILESSKRVILERIADLEKLE